MLRCGTTAPSLLARRAPSALALAVRAKSTPAITDSIVNDDHLFPDQVLEEEKLAGSAGYHMGSPGGLPLKQDRDLWKDPNTDELVRAPSPPQHGGRPRSLGPSP